MERVFDPIRKKWVALTPEERVRQALLQKLLQSGYPKGALLVETELSRLFPSPLTPRRRVDVLCGKYRQLTFFPMLIAECKQKKWTKEAIRQVEGYCSVVKAPFFLLADEEKIETYLLDHKEKRKCIGSILPFSYLSQLYQKTYHERSSLPL